MYGTPRIQLAHNRRTSIKATIKRASASARRDMGRLDRELLDQLQDVYRQARDEIEYTIRGYAGSDGSLRLEVLQDLRRQINSRLNDLELARDRMLLNGIDEASRLGVSPYSGATVSGSLNRIADDAARFVQNFVAEDGLQLSDRIWRINRHERDLVAREIESAIIQGHSASQAAQDFIERGLPVPRDVAEKLGIANADRVARISGAGLMAGKGSPYDNAKRLFRTEINRAHGEAYMAGGEEVDGFIGWRFLLSPRHPAPDICDMHASVNRSGLGPGVYPTRESVPWPAHPNTLSYVEIVFEDEISDEDRDGKENRIDWLKKQTGSMQEGVLAGRKKRAALQRGILRENEIATPWNVLKKRYSRRGIDIDQLVVKSDARLPATGEAVGIEKAREEAYRYVVEQGEAKNYEYAVVYDDQGREVLRKTSRSKNSVSFDINEMAMFADRRNSLELVHNHPSSSSLSPPDLRISTLPGIRSIIAVGHDGTIYTSSSITSAKKLTRAINRVRRLVKDEIWPLVNNSKLSPSEANVLDSHLRNTVLDQLEMISYRADNVSGRLKSVLATVGTDWFDETVNNIVTRIR